MSRRPIDRLSGVLCAAVMLAAAPLDTAMGAPAADCRCNSPVQAPKQAPTAAPTATVSTIWRCRKVEIPLSTGISQYGGNVCTNGVLTGAFGQQDVSKLPLLSSTASCATSSTFCYGPFRATATDTPPDPSPTPTPIDPNSMLRYPPVFAMGAPGKPKYDEGTKLLELNIPQLFQSKLVRHEVVEYPVGSGAAAKTIRVELFAIAYEFVVDPKTAKIVKGTYLVGREIEAGRERLTAKVAVRAIAQHAHEVTIQGETQPFVVVNHSQSPSETRFIVPEDGGDDGTGCDCRRSRLRNLLRGCRR
ncbi:MAG TPA: hypothetical protein PLV92_18115 [Pirellulaceae bacterium]|nr:hypothetical protein [Pirellulaceae bacterium]